MDQIELGCTVEEAARMGYNLRLSPGPAHRVHLNERVKRKSTDAHLAGFRLAVDSSWLHEFLNTALAWNGNEQAYQEYCELWRNNITSIKC